MQKELNKKAWNRPETKTGKSSQNPTLLACVAMLKICKNHSRRWRCGAHGWHRDTEPLFNLVDWFCQFSSSRSDPTSQRNLRLHPPHLEKNSTLSLVEYPDTMARLKSSMDKYPPH